MAIWVGREWHTHVGREAAGDIVHLVDPLLLAPLVLEPHLDHPHRQPRLLGKLLTHLPCWLRVLVKAVLENLELFCLDCRSWSAPLSILGQLTLLLRHVHRVPALLLIVRPGAMRVRRLRLPLHCQLVRYRRAIAGVQVKVLASVLGHLRPCRAAIGVLDVVNLAEEVTPVVASNLVPLRQVGRAVPAGEAVRVEQALSNLPRFVRLGKHQLASRASRAKHPVEVLPTVELPKLAEAAVGEGGAAGGTFETLLMETAFSDTKHELIGDMGVALGAHLHIRHGQRLTRPRGHRGTELQLSAVSDHLAGSSLSAVRRSEASWLRRPRLRGPNSSPLPPRLCRLHLTDRVRFAKRPKSIYFSTNRRAGNGRDGVWATWVTSGARPAGQGGMLGAEEGPGRQEGRGEREGEGREGEVVRGRPGGWVLGKASSFNTSLHPHHPHHPHHRNLDHHQWQQPPSSLLSG